MKSGALTVVIVLLVLLLIVVVGVALWAAAKVRAVESAAGGFDLGSLVPVVAGIAALFI